MDASSLNFDFTDPQTLTRLLGIAIPILVGVISKKIASQGLKATLNALLSAVGGSLVYLTTADQHHYAVGGFVNAVLNTFIVSIATYYGVWKPTGIAGTVAEKTSSFGLGPTPVLETDDKGEESPADAAGEPQGTDADSMGGDIEALAAPTAAGLPLIVAKKAPARKAPAKKAVKRVPPPLP